MRGRVLASVRGRLRAAGVTLDAADLEACYAQAWHGLYTTMLEGGAEIANPEGWLGLVTLSPRDRRAPRAPARARVRCLRRRTRSARTARRPAPPSAISRASWTTARGCAS